MNCRKIVKFVSITHGERNILNGPVVATTIPREKRKPVFEGNGCQNTPVIYTHPCTSPKNMSSNLVEICSSAAKKNTLSLINTGCV
jgi:hypothetical protein